MKIFKTICIVILAVILTFVISAVSLTALFVCSDNTRSSPLSTEQIENALSEKYGCDFTVLKTEDNGNDLYHTVRYNNIPDITFIVHDMNDGIGGWSLSDEFPEQVLVYCAQNTGLSVSDEKHHFYYSIILPDDFSAPKAAELLMKTADKCFEIYSFDSSCKERSITFYINSTCKVTIYDSSDTAESSSNVYKFYRDSTAEEWMELTKTFY